MYCSKCKYTTFDHFDNCPKCGRNWQEEKSGLGLGWLNFAYTPLGGISEEKSESVLASEEGFAFENNQTEPSSEEFTFKSPSASLLETEEPSGDIEAEISFDSENLESTATENLEEITPEIEAASTPEPEIEPVLEANLDEPVLEQVQESDNLLGEETSSSEDISLAPETKEESLDEELDSLLDLDDTELDLSFEPASLEEDLEEPLTEDLEDLEDVDLDLELEEKK